MKKVLLILTICAALCFVGCGNSQTKTNVKKDTNESSKATLYVESDDGIMAVDGYASEDEMSYDQKDFDEKNKENDVYKIQVDAYDVVIPDEVKGNNITAIGEDAFKNCSLIKSITIPETVRMIEDSAFGGCSENLVLKVKKDSAGLEIAKKLKIKYEIIK